MQGMLLELGRKLARQPRSNSSPDLDANRNGSDSSFGTMTGIARKGKRTKELVKTLRPGDLAIIDHADIDALAAQALVDANPIAIIDVALPTTGRYPNRGPALLAREHIPLFVANDPGLFDKIVDGVEATISPDGQISQSGRSIGLLERWTDRRIQEETERARGNLASELDKFTANTLSYIREEKALLLEPVAVPELLGCRSMAKRHVVVVVRGEGYREDLNSIKGYIQDFKPILIAVDGAADALLQSGLKPDIILGDMDSISNKALKCGSKLVVHAYARDGSAPGMERVLSLGLNAEQFPVAGTSEDAAMLLAYEKGAQLIVAVGTHSNLEHFLDKGRSGMASTFLVRLKVGARLIDARGVSQLHHRSIGLTELAALVLSALFVVVVLVTQSPFGGSLIESGRLWWRLHFR